MVVELAAHLLLHLLPPLQLLILSSAAARRTRMANLPAPPLFLHLLLPLPFVFLSAAAARHSPAEHSEQAAAALEAAAGGDLASNTYAALLAASSRYRSPRFVVVIVVLILAIMLINHFFSYPYFAKHNQGGIKNREMCSYCDQPHLFQLSNFSGSRCPACLEDFILEFYCDHGNIPAQNTGQFTLDVMRNPYEMLGLKDYPDLKHINSFPEWYPSKVTKDNEREELKVLYISLADLRKRKPPWKMEVTYKSTEPHFTLRTTMVDPFCKFCNTSH